MPRYTERPHPSPGLHTGGMIALLPDAESAERLTHSAGDVTGELHMTLVYLGDDVSTWSVPAVDAVWRAAGTVAADPALPLTARAFAHASFNPDGGPDDDRDPCAVHLIGDTPDLGLLRNDAIHLATGALASNGFELPRQHEPFIPHVTAGWGLTAASLHYTGPVRFDRVVLALGPRWIEVTR